MFGKAFVAKPCTAGKVLDTVREQPALITVPLASLMATVYVPLFVTPTLFSVNSALVAPVITLGLSWPRGATSRHSHASAGGSR